MWAEGVGIHLLLYKGALVQERARIVIIQPSTNFFSDMFQAVRGLLSCPTAHCATCDVPESI
jgi:hypothetical protein